MWKKAKTKLLVSSPDKQPKAQDLEGADPELCISLFQRGSNISGLKKRLEKADQEWMESFLEHGGLSSIFDALAVLGERGFSSLEDALRQLLCVACIKAVMNSEVGLNFIIHYPDMKYLRKLSEGANETSMSLFRLNCTIVSITVHVPLCTDIL